MSEYELDFWQDCCNTWHEEQKQFVYAKRMGLQANWSCAHPPTYDVAGKTIVDIGGGPVSLLLKCVNLGSGVVLDPAGYPDWVYERYRAHGIAYWQQPGEAIEGEQAQFDEAWIYNTLQHVDDPGQVIAGARRCADIVRIFEWIDIPPYPGHPHTLTQEFLEGAFGVPGFTAVINESGAVGRAFYGVYDQSA